RPHRKTTGEGLPFQPGQSVGEGTVHTGGPWHERTTASPRNRPNPARRLSGLKASVIGWHSTQASEAASPGPGRSSVPWAWSSRRRSHAMSRESIKGSLLKNRHEGCKVACSHLHQPHHLLFRQRECLPQNAFEVAIGPQQA